MGNTAVSLHTLDWGGGGILGYSKLKVSSPDQILMGVGGSVFLATQNSKSQVLIKFHFQGGGLLLMASYLNFLSSQ